VGVWGSGSKLLGQTADVREPGVIVSNLGRRSGAELDGDAWEAQDHFSFRALRNVSSTAFARSSAACGRLPVGVP